MLNNASCYAVRLLRSCTYCVRFKSAMLLLNSEINHKYVYYNFWIESFVFLFQANVSNDIAYQLTEYVSW